MPKSTLALKSTVTRRQAEPVPPDMAERLEQLQHHQAAKALESAKPETTQQPEPEKPAKRYDPHALQSAFLGAHLNRSVACYLTNGVRLAGKLKQYDQYCMLIEGPDGAVLVFKHALSTVARS